MPRLMRARIKRGMTLIEIMISLVLLGIVGGVIMRVIMRQQRFYQGVNQIMSQRGQLRQATTVLPIDLRSLSSIGDDIKVATDSSMEFMINVGTGIVCEVIDGTQVALPPPSLASGQMLTSWYSNGEPTAGTTVFIYNDSSVVGNEDDRWQKFTLVNVHHDASKCALSFTLAADAAKERPILELSSTEPNDVSTGGPISRYINVGAPVRVMKRVRYALFRQASDSKWYLGYATYNTSTSAYGSLVPVSGPYDPYGSASGFAFKYFDVDGNELASAMDSVTREKIARVDLVARARTSSNVRAVGIQGGADQQYRDSLAVSVMLRNRN